jgi:prevent-host-death family protein
MDEISVEKARPKLGDLVRDAQRYGVATRITLNGKPAALLVPLSQLNETDRRLIDRARALHESADLEAVRSAAGDSGISTYAEAFGVARVVFGDLLAIIDRGDGHG